MRACRPALLVMLLLLGACARQETITFAYVPQGQVLAASGPPLQLVVLDQRRSPATTAGEVRGLFGSLSARASTAEPVAALVRQGFADGLQARGLSLAAAGAEGATLTIQLQQFEAVQVVQRGATARLTATLSAGGQARWQGEVRVRETEPTIHGGPGSGQARDLAPLLALLLRGTVNRVLDDPGFRAALAR